MANVFLNLPVPAGTGVGAWVDVSGQGPERTISVDGGAFDGQIYLEGSNDAQASAQPVAVGPFVGPTFKPQTFVQAFNFLRVRRRGSAGVGTPTVAVSGPPSSANVYAAMNVPNGDGVGATSVISAGGDINTFAVSGDFGGQILIETSTDGVNFSPTLLFDNGGAVGQQVTGVLNAARVRRRGSVPGAALPLVSVGSQASQGSGGAGGTVNSVNAGTAISIAGPATDPVVNNIGVTSLVAGAGIGVSGATGAVTVTNTGVTSAVAGAGIGVSGATGAVTFTNTGVTSIVAGAGIAVSGATGAVTVSAVGGAFPGFSVAAPPNVATASAVGGAATAARGDHTHGLDLVTYTPSVAGMQAAGVIQQTFPNPTAVPQAFAVASALIPFGAAGILTTVPEFFYNATGTRRFVVSQAGTGVTTGNVSGAFSWVIGQSPNSNILQRFYYGSGAGPAAPVVVISASRGTFTAQTANSDGDDLAILEVTGHNGTAGGQQASLIVTTAWTPPALGTPIQSVMHFQVTNTATITSRVLALSGLGDVRLGTIDSTVPNAATNGFTWYQQTATAPPTGVPVAPTRPVGWTGVPTIFDAADLRYYGFMGGTWHFSQFMDYDPGANVGRLPFVGATAHTLTDSDTLSFAVTATHGALTVGTAVGLHDGSIRVNSGADGQSLGPVGTAGIYVVDPNALGAANIAVDDGVLCQYVVGYSNLSFQDLSVGAHTGTVLHFSYLAGNPGGTDAGTLQGGTGATAFGLTATATFAVGIAGTEAIQVAPNAAGSDVLVGWNGGLLVGSTHGYPYMPQIGQRPTGAPNAFANASAFAVDLTTASGHALYLRNPTGGQWEPIPTFISSTAPGAGVALINNAPGALVSLAAKWWTFKDATGTTTYIPFFQ